MPSGSYSALGLAGKSNLEQWASEGNNTLIAYGNALRWLASNNIANINIKSRASKSDNNPRPYNMISRDRGSNVIGGAILNINVDLTHPVFYGYNNETIQVFRKGNVFLNNPANKYSCPAYYGTNPLTSGYVSSSNLELLASTPAVIGSRFKRSAVICFADNPNFRAFWHNTQKMSANAIFFGSSINRSALN